jgi:hypothetical protein
MRLRRGESKIAQWRGGERNSPENSKVAIPDSCKSTSAGAREWRIDARSRHITS